MSEKTSKLEEMARIFNAKIKERHPNAAAWESLASDVQEDLLVAMRAAIAVLREPSEAMKRRIKKAIEDEADFFWDVYEVALDAMEDE